MSYQNDNTSETMTMLQQNYSDSTTKWQLLNQKSEHKAKRLPYVLTVILILLLAGLSSWVQNSGMLGPRRMPWISLGGGLVLLSIMSVRLFRKISMCTDRVVLIWEVRAFSCACLFWGALDLVGAASYANSWLPDTVNSLITLCYDVYAFQMGQPGEAFVYLWRVTRRSSDNAPSIKDYFVLIFWYMPKCLLGHMPNSRIPLSIVYEDLKFYYYSHVFALPFASVMTVVNMYDDNGKEETIKTLLTLAGAAVVFIKLIIWPTMRNSIILLAFAHSEAFGQIHGDVDLQIGGPILTQRGRVTLSEKIVCGCRTKDKPSTGRTTQMVCNYNSLMNGVKHPINDEIVCVQYPEEVGEGKEVVFANLRGIMDELDFRAALVVAQEKVCWACAATAASDIGCRFVMKMPQKHLIKLMELSQQSSNEYSETV